MGLASLGGVPFRIDPHSVAWRFTVNVKDRKTLGGKVIQVLGTDLGDMTVEGVFGHGDKTKGDTAGWEEQERFRQRIKRMTTDLAGAGAKGRPVRFLYPPKKWDFNVYVKDLGPISLENKIFNPPWTLTLFIERDNTRVVVKGIRDLYIQRLMAGIGWKQTAYNGPMTQAEVDEFLTANQGTAGDALGFVSQNQSFFERAVATSGTSTVPTGGGGG